MTPVSYRCCHKGRKDGLWRTVSKEWWPAVTAEYWGICLVFIYEIESEARRWREDMEWTRWRWLWENGRWDGLTMWVGEKRMTRLERWWIWKWMVGDPVVGLKRLGKRQWKRIWDWSECEKRTRWIEEGRELWQNVKPPSRGTEDAKRRKQK